MYLRDWGFRPHTAVDVGAFTGDWTTLVKGIYPSCVILMIEPQMQLRSVLDDLCARYDGVRCESALLGADDDVLLPFVHMGTGSSVFEEQALYRAPRCPCTRAH